MKLHLSIQETLIWYDSPQLFVARDQVGGLYVALAIDEGDGAGKYIAVAISLKRLLLLKAGKKELREIYAEPEIRSWFEIASLNDKQTTAEIIPGLTALPDEWLPAPGMFLPNYPFIDARVFDSVKVKAVAAEAGMNPSLLRQYLSGSKRPSKAQLERIQNALHRLGEGLLEVQFV